MSSFVPHIPEEMLSAYLDHELGSEDRARVDDALAKDRQLRVLLEDLEGIRRDLQSLPRHSLPADFARRVAVAIHARPLAPQPEKPRADWSRARHARWIAGIATAAALLLATLPVFQSPRPIASRNAPTVAQVDAMPSSASPVPLAAEAANLNMAPREDDASLEQATPLVAEALSADAQAPLAPFEDRESMDAVVTIHLSQDQLRAFRSDGGGADPGERIMRRSSKQAGGNELAAVTNEAEIQLRDSPSDWNDRFADLGVQRPSQVIVMEGTADEINSALLPLRSQLTRTLTVRDSDTMTRLSLPSLTSVSREGFGAGQARDVTARSLPANPSAPRQTMGTDLAGASSRAAIVASPSETQRTVVAEQAPKKLRLLLLIEED